MELKLRREHFLNHYPPFNLFKSGETERMFEKKPVHLYVHLPFCPTKCKYCYYKSFEDHSPQAIDAYLEDLKREITIYGRQPEVKNKIVKTMYFGGGTPSYLSYEQYTGLVRFLYDHFEFEEGFEFCSEARPSPDSISQDKLQMLKEMGVNRLSMGVQNLNNEILQLNGRDATKEFFHEVFHNAREIGFE
ncbi:MAG: radical SAM protein, partial [bacterium]|nr:radical SAM protein [bacterium]